MKTIALLTVLLCASSLLVSSYCDGINCYNNDSEFFLDSEDVFPNVDANTSQITFLLNSTNITDQDSRWEKVRKVWMWMENNENVYCTAPGSESSPSGFSSIGNIAETYYNCSGIDLGACVTKARIMTMLLYRQGVPRDEVAVVGRGSIFHFYTAIKIEDQWHYVDPTCMVDKYDVSFPENISNIGCLDEDYHHPQSIMTLPGSSLTQSPIFTELKGDLNENGKIDLDEKIVAIIAWSEGKISLQSVIEIIQNG